MALPQLVNTGAFTNQNLKAINANFMLLAGMAGAGVFGQSYYVDPVHGSDNYDGSADFPTKTIQKAVDTAIAGRGDTIFIAQGSYKENVHINKNYIALIGGLNAGYGHPDIVPTTGVPVTVNGQGVILCNLRMAGTAADACVQKGNGFIIINNVFDGDLTAGKAGLRLVPSDTNTHLTASEGQVLNNYFRGSAIGLVFDTSAPAVGVGSTDNVIRNNRFSANTIDIAAANTGGDATYSAKFTSIAENLFMDHNKAVYIDLTTNASGVLSDESGLISQNEFCSSGINTSNVKIAGTHWCFVSNEDETGIINGTLLGGEGPAAPPLGVAATYSAGARASVSNTGATTMPGLLYLTPGSSITGAPTTGGNHVNDAAALAASAAVLAAYNNARSIPGALPLPGNITGVTLFPGTYDNGSSVLISGGNVTLDAQGNADAVFVLRTGSTLTLITTAGVTLINGAQAKNVYWIVGSSATLGAGSTLKGNVLAAVSITLNTAALVTGRLFAGADGTVSGALVLDTNTVTAP